jgi:PAS domain S-box-containing protein
MPLFAQDLKDYFQHSRQFYHLITDSDARIIQANELFIDQLSIHTNKFEGISMCQLILPEHLEKFYQLLSNLKERKDKITNSSFCYRGKGSERIKICWETTFIRNNGDPTGHLQWLGIEEHQSKDVFDQMGRTLQDIRERFHAYELSSEGIWKVELHEPVSTTLPVDVILDHCKKFAIITDCNDNIARTFGYSSANELIGKPISDLMNLEEPKIQLFLKELIENDFHSANIQTTERDKNGNIIHLLNNITCILENDKMVRVWGTVQDITTLTKTEEQLRQSELFYRNLITESLDGMLLTKEDASITFASPSVERILGFQKDTLVGMNTFDLVHPDDQPPAREAFVEGQKKDVVYDFLNVRLLHNSGKWIWCMVRVHSLLPNPNVRRVIIYFSDNTARKNAEDALIASEHRFRTLMENLSVGVQLFSPDGNMILFNPAALELLDLKEDKVLGTPGVVPYDIIHEDGTLFKPEDYPIAISLREKISVKNVVLGVGRPALKDRVWIILNSTPVLDENGELNYVITSYANITEHKKLTQQLNEQELIKQKHLLQVTIDAQERERREIGRELHDNISQHLTITRLHLEVAKELADGELSEAINRAHKSLLGIVNEIRRLSHSLVPPSLSDIGLTASVQDMCDGLSGSYVIEFMHDGFDETDLPENLKLTLYRIIQEQVNNIIRHANAKKIFISLQFIEGTILLFIEDDGQGFEMNAVRKGMGFTNIRNRAGIFGGTVKVDSSDGKGCLVEVEIPVG